MSDNPRVLHHTVRGEGEIPVILLHGFLGAGRNLGALVRLASAQTPHLRWVIPDLPGHGRSPPLPPDGGLAHMAQAVLELAESLGLKAPMTFVGHSLGGRVALQARLLDPYRTGDIVLLDIRPGPIHGSDTETIIERLVEAPERADSRDAMRRILEDDHGLSAALSSWLLMSGDSGSDGFAWRVDRARLKRFHEEHRAQDLWAAVENPARTLCIRGADSDYVGADDIARFEAAQVVVETIENAGHFLHVEQTEAVAASLVRALRSPD